MNIDWTPVKSSNIAALSYAAGAKLLCVKFISGTIYEYANVEQEVAEQLQNAPSVGSAFSCLIKKHPDVYPFRKLA